MTDDELNQLPKVAWMASRIPAVDALVAHIPKGGELPESLIPSSYERRYYPQQNDSITLKLPYTGGEFDSTIFQLESKAWNHTTCDNCVKVIPAMTLCYVTKYDPYVCLCSTCYRQYIVHKSGIGRLLRWYGKFILGINVAA